MRKVKIVVEATLNEEWSAESNALLEFALAAMLLKNCVSQGVVQIVNVE